jgi:hypothetical protein
MDDIIHVNASPTREHAEKKRLTYKDADNYGLFCAFRNDGTQSWVVLPNHVLELIHDTQSIDKKWVELDEREKYAIADFHLFNPSVFQAMYEDISAKLKEKNT